MPEESKDDVIIKDLLSFRIEAERKLAILETSINALKEDVSELKFSIKDIFKQFELLRKEIDKYKWWLLTGFFGSTILAVFLKIIFGV